MHLYIRENIQKYANNVNRKCHWLTRDLLLHTCKTVQWISALKKEIARIYVSANRSYAYNLISTDTSTWPLLCSTSRIYNCQSTLSLKNCKAVWCSKLHFSLQSAFIISNFTSLQPGRNKNSWIREGDLTNSRIEHERDSAYLHLWYRYISTNHRHHHFEPNSWPWK